MMEPKLSSIMFALYRGRYSEKGGRRLPAAAPIDLEAYVGM
jgi:hypothetical protein